MRTRSPLLEIDFYMHKSNASFITDVDVARSHLIASLIGMDTIRSPPSSLLLESHTVNSTKDGARGPVKKQRPLAIVLAGIEGSFRREIKPYEMYEVWTRVLAWDEKWVYFASWFVRARSVTSIQNQTALHDSSPARRKGKVLTRDEAEKAVLALVVSRNIMKLGRETVNPGKVWAARGLLGPEVERAAESRRTKALQAIKEGDQAALMELWVEMVTTQNGIQVLGDYSDIWAWA